MGKILNRIYEDPLQFVLVAIFVSLGIAIAINLIGGAIDDSFDNKDIMLCESAKVSGNEQYLQSCECFYEGDDIRCIYEFRQNDK